MLKSRELNKEGTIGSHIEIAFVFIAISLWFIFPVGLFIAMNHIDKSVDGVVQLGHEPVGTEAKVKALVKKHATAWRRHWPQLIQRLRHH
jgi:hypothetical protein